jgi:Ca-activated chloride channel family protein
MRRFLNDGTLPPRDAIRVEELINYFDYDYQLPRSDVQPFKINTYLYQTPWNEGTQLLHIGIKGYDIVPDKRPPSNLVLLLDVSGSMNQQDKLPLLKKSMGMLVDQMDENDTISIVVYAGAAGTVLEPTSGAHKSKIMGALDLLNAGGSTAGGEGIRQAYALAEANFKDGAVNRVILATDGDFNVGINDPERLEDFVAAKRDSGVFLTVLGFGRGNYHDVLMQKLAQAGNGNAAYIDSIREAQKVLIDEMSSTLFPIASDVKIQVEFNPTAVKEYRLIGYETRMLEREDFNNDKVDAGEIGSGHTVTAIYEIVPVGSDAGLIDPLRYEDDIAKSANKAMEVAFVRVRHKKPGEEDSHLIEEPVMIDTLMRDLDDAPDDIRFAASVAAFGQHLKGATHLKAFDLDEILDLARSGKGQDEFGYRSEFIQLVRSAKTARGLPELGYPGSSE